VSANLELVKSIFAAWEKGDFSSVEWADPDIEFEIIGGPNPSRSRGLTGMSKTWGSMLSAWDDFRAIAEEFRELDDERVLVFLTNQGRGKSSGIDVREISRSANLFTIRDGRVTKFVGYWQRDDAIADLDL
jgi:ketosteroid isomerase-like protein